MINLLNPFKEFGKLRDENANLIKQLKKNKEKNTYNFNLNRSLRVKLINKQQDFVLLKNTYQDSIRKPNQKQLKKWSIDVRKNKVCDICLSADELQAHHVFPKCQFNQLALERTNGVCLCSNCHNGYHERYPETCNLITYNEFKEDCQNKLKIQAYNNLTIWQKFQNNLNI